MNHDFKQFVILAAAALLSVATAFASTIARPTDRVAVITAIKDGGIVTGTDAKGRPYSFEVKDAKLLKTLKAGQKVMINTVTGHVSVPGAEQCCSLLKPKT